ncbi:hypothetical protein [Leptolyngbya sp. FACHB-261]|uniref:hypothetical protein n=1 Tax=Leptolyngbya sp. FACHB-261 TaxID=2692806 RepID=UPI0016848976|nr:hypothetical protein [Leptolyngbya sp. FACHB-261]MBD2103080.1 hypothetical protein [Leptolyngbya sp. FACHB-261]
MAGKHAKEPKDVRLAATQKIWAYGTGMLALSLIFGPVKNSVALPSTIVVGTAISTALVWRSTNKRSESSLALPEALEQRVANLEEIVSSEELELRERLRKLESTR